MGLDLTTLRQEYTQASLDIDSVASSPFDQFQTWFDQAQKGGIKEPNAMVLGTSDQHGKVTQRTVLLKSFDESGFIFYTNYKSRKAIQIETNPYVSMLFPWHELERQVSISGAVEKIRHEESMEYFLSRPFKSQLGALVSHQSEVLESRGVLEEKLKALNQKYTEGNVPLPDFWGGYKVIPDSIEFWQGRQSRLHDRIFYEKMDSDWSKKRLSP